MHLWDMFRRRPCLREPAAVADFIDAQAAFLAQKGIYEYSRARAGHYSKVLFHESAFQHAVEQARWRAYPLALSMVAEMVEGVLRPYVGENRRALLDPLTALVLSIFDRYPAPAQLSRDEWVQIRRDLARRLDLIGMHAVKSVKDIPEPFAKGYFALMPIHEKLRGQDFSTVRNYLRVTLCNIHDDFLRRADLAALSETLRARAA